MDLFELSATLRLDTSEYERATSKAEKMASDLDKKLGKAGGFSGASVGSGSGIIGRIGSGLGKLASIGTKAFSGMANVGMKSMSMLAKGGQVAFSGLTKGIGMVTKAATIGMGSVAALGAAFAPMVKGAVSAFSSYEQLVGGVETLFKDSAGFVLHDANEAFKTAGMSANQYMENVTSFAASMIQGLGGDTMKAAEMSNMAITDMADNVNKMGTSMESVEYAYRGFSKQNYTMLDNLKLGYGGTRAEMERLLSDAEKLTGKKYDISNFADVVDAIHAIQVEMGITGTTAKEAETTIQGSASRMKASWQNVLTVLANPRGIKNLKAVAQEFGESLTVYISNLAPSIKAAVMGLPTLITELSPVIEEQIPNLISDIIPTIINSGIDLGIALVKGITKTLKKIDFGKIFKTAGSKIKTVATDWLGLPSDASISEIMASLGTKIRKGLKAAKDKAKIALANLIGLTNDDGTPITDVSQIDGRAFVIALVAKIKEGIGAAVVGLLNLIGIVGEDGNPITGIDDVNWTSIADSIVKAVQNAAKTVTFSLAAFLGLDNPEDATLGQVIQGLLDKAVNGLKFGNTFLKKLLLGDEGYRALQEEIAKEKATPGFKPNEARIAATEVGWGAVIDRAFKDLTSGLDDTSWFKDGLHVVLDLAEGIPAFVTSLISEFTKLLGQEGVGAEFGSTFAKIITDALDKAPDWITNLSNFAVDFINEFAKEENISKIFKGIANVIESLVTNSGKITKALGTALFNIIKSPDAWAAITGIIDDLLFKLPQAIADGLWAALVDGIFGQGAWQKAKSDEGFIGFVTKLLTGDVQAAADMLFGYGGEKTVVLAEQGNAGNVKTEAEIPVYDTNKYVSGEEFVPQESSLSKMTPKEYNQTLEALMKYYGFSAEEGAGPYRQRMVGAFRSNGSHVDENGNSVSNYYDSVGKFINDITKLTEGDNDVLQLLMRNVRDAESTGDLEQVAEALHRLRAVSDLINMDYHHDPNKGNAYDLLRKAEYFSPSAYGSFSGMLTDEGYSELIRKLSEVKENADAIASGEYEIKFKVDAPWLAPPSTQSESPAPYAKGLWSVPYNGYIAMLHRNERVLTASQARQSDYGGGNADVVAAIQSLKNDLQNLKLVVGQKIFGSAVVDYGGKRMNNYIGKAEDKMVAGYGWG